MFQHTKRVEQRQAPHDAVAHIQLDEVDNLRGSRVEIGGRARVLFPIQSEVGRKNAAAGDGYY